MRSHAKGAKARADKYFSLIVRSRGACERCGSTQNLQCAHIVSRRYNGTRCVLENAWCLCAGCHLRLTNEPYEHVAFARETRGEDGYSRLRQLALDGGRVGARVDWESVADELRTEWNQIKGTA